MAQVRTITIQEVTADEGMYLTQVNRAEDEAPIMARKILNPLWEYKQIPIEEGDRIVAEWQAEQERKMREEDARMQEEMNTNN